ncbi:unnamed protein product [Durusdinium trenchii]|uniref:Carrier domain-containing protein n=1 Tax=Durusdinium trenchii TaxID=1381693 RepID=A0ABP0KJS5_9DINO
MSLATSLLEKHDFTTWADLRARFRADSPLVAGDLGSSCLTYQQFLTWVDEVLRPSFTSAKLCPSERIASLLPNGPEAAMLFLGTALCGLCLGPLDPQLTRSELDFALQDLPASALVLGDLSSVALALAELAAQELQLELFRLHRGGRFEFCSPCSATAEHPTQPDTAPQTTLAVPCLKAQSHEEIVLALHTSGTTRRPKLVPLSHGTLCSGALCIASTLKIQQEDVVMNCLPLFHIHGLAVNVLVPAIAGAMSVCLSGPFDAAAVLKRLNTEPQITLYSAVPTLHQLIFTAKSESDLEDSYPSLRLIRSCSAHLPSALARSLALALDVEVLPTYAMTESMPIASPAPHGGMRGGARPRFHGTLGWAAGPEVRLLTDPLTDLLTADDVGPMATRTSEAATTTSRTLKPLEEGLEGEICVRGACVTRGYELRRDEEDPNRDAFVEGWFRTGDLAKVCKEGLILSGRNKEIINKSGEKFAPLQIEEVYLQHPLIKDCVAFAATCEKRGEAIGLAIETGDRSEEDLQQCNLDALRMFGRRTQELRLVALPDCVVWMTRLLRTATGRAPSDAAPGAFHFTLRLAQRFERFSQRVDVAAGAAGIGEVLRTVRDVVMELVRCDFEDDQPLMDVGIDSLSATTLINRLEMKLDINLAGDDGAVSLLDKYPSLQKLAAAAFLAMQKKDIDTASARSTHRPRMPYFGLGRRTSLKQFVVDARDPNSLLFAAQHGHAEQIRRSCEGVLSSMSPDEEVDKNGLTALHYAAGKGDLEIVGLLLELKAGVDTRNKDLRTPLMWAARNGHVDVCEELVRCQADVLASNKLGICCLHWAAWGGSLEAVAFLLEKEANIDAVCHAGCNVAVWAATAGSFDMCQWLHQKRADFASTNKNGHGVLNKACWRGHSVKLISWMLNLEGVEAQLFESDWDGELPLDRARQKGHSALAEWLRDEMCERRPSWQDCAKQSSEEDPKVPDCAKGAALDL